MNATHTPGPWMVEHDEDECGENVRVLMASALECRSAYVAHHVITIYEGVTHEPQAREIEANARLIAAAPDLLAALKQIHTCACYTQENQDARDAMLLAIGDAARAAIAKAESR